MFPTPDFNFVVAGIATFAATVGYACSRRLSSSSSSLPIPDILRDSIMSDAQAERESPSPTVVDFEELSDSTTAASSMVVETVTVELTKTTAHPTSTESSMVVEVSTVTEVSNAPIALPPASLPSRKDSLKRKAPHDGFDEAPKEELGYPHNLTNIYPNKRSRTPTSQKSRSTSPPIQASKSRKSVTPDAVEVKAEDVETPTTPERETTIEATPVPERDQRAPSPEAVGLATPEPTPPPAVAIVEVEPVLALPPLLAAPVLVVKGPKVTQPNTEAPSAPFPFLASPTPNPFASYTNKSPFGSPAATRPATPKSFASPPGGGFASFAGTRSPFASFGKSPEQSTFGRASSQRSIWSANDITSQQNEDPAETFLHDLLPVVEKNNAIEGSKKEPPAASVQLPEKYTPVTGEEGEQVEMELKGLKLFVKRGSSAFSEGILGQIKLLSNLETQEQRLLFRREPLLKVSMNMRLQPTVRAAFVPEENVLKLILKESIEVSATETKQEVVIYAVKPGKACNKQDFKNFAESLMSNENLKAPTKVRSA
ncbi:hypothetical protein D9619_006779 [Psilocybe cf. subviscida]|uniref:RanBD1 domain-containing protein n=1 Tax=Psilocybe cf. subviscida TaxID=2480587 RepID=A0A8H5B4T6_9AGAR|nr:hypothetical protein D9619_006779 [Psilocybe cf. subviscida]